MHNLMHSASQSELTRRMQLCTNTIFKCAHLLYRCNRLCTTKTIITSPILKSLVRVYTCCVTLILKSRGGHWAPRRYINVVRWRLRELPTETVFHSIVLIYTVYYTQYRWLCTIYSVYTYRNVKCSQKNKCFDVRI